MLKLALCDDNMKELSDMITLVEEYRDTRHLDCQYLVFHNGFELIPLLEKGEQFDLYCLDIIMPAFTGIDLAKEIRQFDKNAQIIFFTSSPEYALESYSVQAINYILKPITKEKVFVSLDAALERLTKEEEASMILKTRNGIQKILLSNLLYVEAMGKKVLYYLVSGRMVECSESFSSVCEHLQDKGGFVRTHRSYLVNMRYIDLLSSTQITLQNGAQIPIAQGKAKEIKECYLAFQMEVD